MKKSNELTLRSYVNKVTQEVAGKHMGRSQTAVSLMLSNKRDIRIEVDDDGNYLGWYEVKRGK